VIVVTKNAIDVKVLERLADPEILNKLQGKYTLQQINKDLLDNQNELLKLVGERDERTKAINDIRDKLEPFTRGELDRAMNGPTDLDAAYTLWKHMQIARGTAKQIRAEIGKMWNDNSEIEAWKSIQLGDPS
jgi:predicted  nucleic acid-binding Zn-ribbon protein